MIHSLKNYFARGSLIALLCVGNTSIFLAADATLDQKTISVDPKGGPVDWRHVIKKSPLLARLAARVVHLSWIVAIGGAAQLQMCKLLAYQALIGAYFAAIPGAKTKKDLEARLEKLIQINGSGAGSYASSQGARDDSSPSRNECLKFFNLQKGFSQAELNKAKRDAQLRFHPDKCSEDKEKFKQINSAFNVLESEVPSAEKKSSLLESWYKTEEGILRNIFQLTSESPEKKIFDTYVLLTALFDGNKLRMSHQERVNFVEDRIMDLKREKNLSIDDLMQQILVDLDTKFKSEDKLKFIDEAMKKLSESERELLLDTQCNNMINSTIDVFQKIIFLVVAALANKLRNVSIDFQDTRKINRLFKLRASGDLAESDGTSDYLLELFSADNSKLSMSEKKALLELLRSKAFLSVAPITGGFVDEKLKLPVQKVIKRWPSFVRFALSTGLLSVILGGGRCAYHQTLNPPKIFSSILNSFVLLSILTVIGKAIGALDGLPVNWAERRKIDKLFEAYNSGRLTIPDKLIPLMDSISSQFLKLSRKDKMNLLAILRAFERIEKKKNAATVDGSARVTQAAMSTGQSGAFVAA